MPELTEREARDFLFLVRARIDGFCVGLQEGDAEEDLVAMRADAESLYFETLAVIAELDELLGVGAA